MISSKSKEGGLQFLQYAVLGEPFVLLPKESGEQYRGPVQRSGERTEQVTMKRTGHRDAWSQGWGWGSGREEEVEDLA